MPLSTTASYISTMQEFITHWTAVNADLGAAGPLVLPPTYAVANLTADRTALQTRITAVETAVNALELAAGQRDLRKPPLAERLRQFRATVLAYLRNTEYAGALPTIPTLSVSEGRYLRALDDMSNLWTRINAITPLPEVPVLPLRLVGNYLIATFNSDVAGLRSAYGTWNGAVQSLLIAREQRNVLLPPIRQRLVQYRKAVQATYAAGSPLLLSLPAVTPLAGSTPDPVELSGTFADGKVQLAWTPSSNPNLKHYQIRACDPPRYKVEFESVVDTILPPVTDFESNTILLVAGASKFFKVYVVTQDDNEKGSNAVRITRP
jgi:hypothetical protein